MSSKRFACTCVTSCERTIRLKQKKNYFTKVKNKPDLEKHCPPGVLPPDWVWLLAYWRSVDAQKQSEQNSKNRDKHGPAHIIGRKSFAEVRYERRKSKQPTDKMSLWVSSRNADDPDGIETIASVHQRNPRESIREGCTIVSTNQTALNTSTEPEGDTKQSARGVNDEDAV